MSFFSKCESLLKFLSVSDTDSIVAKNDIIVSLADAVDHHLIILTIVIIYAFLVTIALIILAYIYKQRKGKMDYTNFLPNNTKEDSPRININQNVNRIKDNYVDLDESTSVDLNTIQPVGDVFDCSFSARNDGWIVVGTSVIGKSHVSIKLPCQDCNKYVYLHGGWGIAITSDGAGSAMHSNIGSRIVVERAAYYFEDIIMQKEWIKKNNLPTEAEWTNICYLALKAIRDDIKNYSVTKGMDYKSLSATIIVVIHSPLGFLTTHVGDGRAGYKEKDGCWKSLITPHKGEEANQTLFLTSEFWDIPYYVNSGVAVPESHIVSCIPDAFTLMSDGCEHVAWLCYQKNDETGIYYDPNIPYHGFYDPIVKYLYENVTNDQNKKRWNRFIAAGNEELLSEPDDKTMIVGVFKRNH